jgi:hypothetical protein
MSRNARRIAGTALVTALIAGTATGCATVGEWTGIDTLGGRAPAPERVAERATRQMQRETRKYVVIDVDANELRFMDGDQVLWKAPVGTGTGLQLRGESSTWDFSTPNGVFHVQYKEENPDWIIPDWYYVKNKLPIPGEESPQRRMPGGLGRAAVYLGQEIAIHGTDKPELLGQRVSHGCIRLADEYAERLYHNVQVGTPVIIVGGKDIKVDPDAAPPPTNPGKPKPKPADPLLKMTTAQLLKRLDQQIERADTSFAWSHTASVLITRGLGDDSTALRGILRRAGRTENERFEREYATFVADAFARGSLRAVVSLARIEKDARERAATAIVDATMDLYHGQITDGAAPWPTRRVPLWRLGPEGSAGWKALEAAEAEYRQTKGGERVALKVTQQAG